MLPMTKALDKGTIVELRAPQGPVRLHGVRQAGDSISGIPWLERLSCDSCRVQFALKDVSDVHVVHPGSSARVLIPIVTVLGFLVFLWKSSLKGT